MHWQSLCTSCTWLLLWWSMAYFILQPLQRTGISMLFLCLVRKKAGTWDLVRMRFSYTLYVTNLITNSPKSIRCHWLPSAASRFASSGPVVIPTPPRFGRTLSFSYTWIFACIILTYREEKLRPWQRTSRRDGPTQCYLKKSMSCFICQKRQNDMKKPAPLASLATQQCQDLEKSNHWPIACQENRLQEEKNQRHTSREPSLSLCLWGGTKLDRCFPRPWNRSLTSNGPY
jgi:hypothetical protein